MSSLLLSKRQSKNYLTIKNTESMSIFSLSWFKSGLSKELEKLRLEEQRIKNDILRKELEKVADVKPYRAVKLVNDVLTIILTDGTVLTKTSATQEDFINAKTATSEEELFIIITSEEGRKEKDKLEAEYNRAMLISNGIKLLDKTGDFTVVDKSVYLKGTNRSLPQLLVENLIEVVSKYYDGQNINVETLRADAQYQGLKHFFMWCCLNPRAEVADKLYDFLQTNSFRITKQGFFVALRNVVTLHGGTEFIQFISNTYNKVKAVWKKSPNDFMVFKSDPKAFTLIHKNDMFVDVEVEDEYGDPMTETQLRDDLGEFIGNLTELYLDLPNRTENRFTDAHTRTFDIRVGKVVNMPPEKCSWSTADCAEAGLHFTADHINYVGCGDTSVLILINPMKVVGIGELKGRCYEYLPIMTVSAEESTKILHDLDFDTLELDEEYAIRELDGLADKAKAGFTAEVSKYNFNLPKVNTVEIHNIVASLEEMRSSISDRVLSILD